MLKIFNSSDDLLQIYSTNKASIYFRFVRRQNFNENIAENNSKIQYIFYLFHFSISLSQKITIQSLFRRGDFSDRIPQ